MPWADDERAGQQDEWAGQHDERAGQPDEWAGQHDEWVRDAKARDESASGRGESRESVRAGSAGTRVNPPDVRAARVAVHFASTGSPAAEETIAH